MPPEVSSPCWAQGRVPISIGALGTGASGSGHRLTPEQRMSEPLSRWGHRDGVAADPPEGLQRASKEGPQGVGVTWSSLLPSAQVLGIRIWDPQPLLVPLSTSSGDQNISDYTRSGWLRALPGVPPLPAQLLTGPSPQKPQGQRGLYPLTDTPPTGFPGAEVGEALVPLDPDFLAKGAKWVQLPKIQGELQASWSLGPGL